MDYRQLRSMVDQGEGQHIEFKKKLPLPEKFVREAAAFANAGGGWLLFGVADDGTISGVKDAAEVTEGFALGTEKHMNPLPDYEAVCIPVKDGKHVVAIYVEESATKPVYYNPEPGKHRDGSVFYRVKDRSIRASRELKEILRMKNRETGFQFRYEEKERKLIEYLEQHDSISVEEYMELAGVNRFNAARSLVLLTQAGVLDIQPDEKADQFFLTESTEI